MRFLSILRIPKHQRFEIEPRYYDQVKEDMEQRTSRIKRELSRRKGVAGSVEYSRINGAFSRRSRNEFGNTGLLRFFITVYLSGGFGGYLYFGNIFLYMMLSVVPAYYCLRWRKLI